MLTLQYCFKTLEMKSKRDSKDFINKGLKRTQWLGSGRFAAAHLKSNETYRSRRSLCTASLYGLRSEFISSIDEDRRKFLESIMCKHQQIAVNLNLLADETTTARVGQLKAEQALFSA